MTDVIYQLGNYQVNRGSGMANGMYNVSEINGDGLSFWFDEHYKDELIQLNAESFIDECKRITSLQMT